ncbi:NAPE-hydrolyzing phospholipase D [Coniochaeta sp. 2T2.1]|nr:NAPE-hydrolyzing phospholipase D [Coniochaeta sp. 2T2.1]
MRAFHRLRQAFSRNSSSTPSSSSQRASVAASASITAGLVAIPVVMASNYYAASVTKPQLGPDTVPEEALSRPHHVKKRNGNTASFKNIYPSAGTMYNTWTFYKGLYAAKMGGELDPPDTTPPTVTVRKPTFLPTRWSSPSLRATWLGHACYYVEYPSGLRVLFDPVFEDRCSPLSWLGPARYTPRPCDLADLPFVDAVVISHSHYDHLSHPTLNELARRFPDAHFFVGLGLEKWFRSGGIKQVTEMDWWETTDVTLTPKKDGGKTDDNRKDSSTPSSVKSTTPGSDLGEPITARIGCLPAQHSSGRTLTDKDSTLWCSWSVTSSSASSPTPRSVWFGGDTGYRAVPKVARTRAEDGSLLPHDPEADWEPPYDNLPVCPQFEQIGKLRGPFDLGLIPIGAYDPRWLFSHMHANPYDAVEIFRDTRCKKAMGIHWGTWVLTSEEVLEPPRQLRMALKRRGMEEEGVFDVCEIGESREF